MEDVKDLKFALGKGFKFTGREITSKLVISKNQDPEGNCVTLVMKKFGNKFFFIPTTDIYLDYKNTQLIMSKHEPVYVTDGLYRDIIPSSKYKGCYVFAPDSDIQTVFKEIEFPNNKNYWCLVFDRITLHYFTYWTNGDPRSEQSGYFTTHQLNIVKRKFEKEENDYNMGLYQECEDLTNEMLEEAGYDFLD